MACCVDDKNNSFKNTLREKLKNSIVKIESRLLLIVIYTTNKGFIIPSNFNCKEYKCLNNVIYQIIKKWTVAS